VRVAGNRQLPQNAMVRLHWLALLPLAAMLCVHIANHRSASARMTGELLGFLGAFLPLALGYATILLCGRIRMLPRYSYYPGTGKDPVLDNPSWGTIGSVVVVVAASAVILGLARRLLFWKLPEPDFFGAKTVELALLVVIVVAALEHNPYWAVVFFALPAWIWGLVGEGEEVGARAANRIAILGAGIICAFVTVYFARSLGLGWKVFWYEILALWTGTFSAPGALLGAAAAAVGLRMLAIQSLPAR